MSFSTCLLRRHIGGSSSVLRSLADVFFSKCQSEIHDVRSSVLADQDVTRLHVPVDESLFVGMVQIPRDGSTKLNAQPEIRKPPMQQGFSFN